MFFILLYVLSQGDPGESGLPGEKGEKGEKVEELLFFPLVPLVVSHTFLKSKQVCWLYLQGFRGFPGRVGTPGLDGEKVSFQLDFDK